MEWSGRAPYLTGEWRWEGTLRSTAMFNQSNSTVATMGIDIGKNSFHVVGLDQRGTIVLRQKWSRDQVEAARQHAAVPDRDGSLCWRTSPEPQIAIARP
jgi:hypothetical protein